MTLIAKALAYATKAHVGHTRRYAGEPYVKHAIAVAKLVASVTDNEAAVAAALLHDVVEDTPTTVADLTAAFGPEVAKLVSEVTDVSRPSDGNRRTRKELDRAHLAKSSPEGATIKLADLLDNAASITGHDPGFARVYMAEKLALLDVLTHGDAELLARARALVNAYYAEH